jgi:hypothetical protein
LKNGGLVVDADITLAMDDTVTVLNLRAIDDVFNVPFLLEEWRNAVKDGYYIIYKIDGNLMARGRGKDH